MTVSGRDYRLSFYDPVRLGQEIQSEFERGSIFFEPNLVVVKSVTDVAIRPPKCGKVCSVKRSVSENGRREKDHY
jgi:hypothetical protein